MNPHPLIDVVTAPNLSEPPSPSSRLSSDALDAAAQALAALPDTVALAFDLDLRCTLVAGDALCSDGRTAAHFQGKLAADVLPRATYAHFEPLYRAALSGEVSNRDWRRPDGRVFRIRVSPLRDGGGHVIGGMAVGCDITAQRDAETALRDRSQRLQFLTDNLTDALYLFDTTERRAYVYVSPSAERLFGWTSEELLGRSPADFVHPGDLERVTADQHMGANAPDELTLRFRYRCSDGGYRWVESHIRQLRDESDTVTNLTAINRDITERHAAEDELRVAVGRFETAFGEAPIGMALVTFRGDWLKVNAALCELTGYSEAQMLATGFPDITHPDDLHADLAHAGDLLAGLTRRYSMEKRFLRANGQYVWVSLSVSLVRDEHGDPMHFIAQIQDISERKRTEHRLRDLADHDDLTGLLNRRRFEQELVQQSERCRRYGEQAALILLDLDTFKYFNDALGHTVGDELLVTVGQALRRRARAGDVVARLGGDEFAVLAHNQDLAGAQALTEGLLDAVHAATVTVDGHLIQVTASVGVSLLDASMGEADDAMVGVDLAMYAAKANGGNQATLDSCRVDRKGLSVGVQWLRLIRTALAEDRFELVAQPLIAADGSAAWYEMLLRLPIDDGRVASPGEFLGHAERFNLLAEVDRWVIRRTCAILAGIADHDVRLSINLGGQSVSDPSLLDYIRSCMGSAEVSPERLMFEVTETEAIAQLANAQVLTRGLRALGCTVALDDFATGFGSFSHIKHLDFDVIKIDGDFIRDVLVNQTDQLVVRAVVDIAHGLGKTTVAEYVENDAILQFVRDAGVDLAQGFLLGRPAPLEDQLAARDRVVSGASRSTRLRGR